MKLGKIFIAAAAVVSVAACGGKKSPMKDFVNLVTDKDVAAIEKTLEDKLPSQGQVDTVSYLLGLNCGATIKNYNFGDLDMDQLVGAIKEIGNAKGSPRDEDFGKQFKLDPNDLYKTIQGYLDRRNGGDSTIVKATVDSVSYYLGLDFGSSIKQSNFGDLNFDEFRAGVADFVASEGDDFQSEEFLAQFKVNPMQMGEIINPYLEKRNEVAIEVNREKGQLFLEKISKKSGVKKTESGLYYKIIKKGNDVIPSAEDIVKVEYTGMFIDGEEFDKTKEDQPIEFPLNRVIPGWTEGLQLIGEGGEIMLYIPYDLAYGEQSNPYSPIPGCSTLVFNVKLIAVPSKAAAEEAEEVADDEVEVLEAEDEEDDDEE